jgi:hypothetical protein
MQSLPSGDAATSERSGGTAVACARLGAATVDEWKADTAPVDASIRDTTVGCKAVRDDELVDDNASLAGEMAEGDDDNGDDDEGDEDDEDVAIRVGDEALRFDGIGFRNDGCGITFQSAGSNPKCGSHRSKNATNCRLAAAFVFSSDVSDLASIVHTVCRAAISNAVWARTSDYPVSNESSTIGAHSTC